MRKWVALVAGLVVLVTANFAIHNREELLTKGRVVLLALAPVDPRSLMQGDYMALRFAVENLAFPWDSEELQDGHIVLALDAEGVGSFDRFDRGEPLAPNEIRMRYRIRDGRVKFATNAFFFQEGDAAFYEPARFGAFRVDTNGDSILVGLRSGDLSPLGRGDMR